MWSHKAEKLSHLQSVMNFPRANGKTWVMINGIANAENGAVVLVANQAQADRLKRECRNPKIKYVSLENIEQLRGNRLPVVLDHTTVSYALSYAFEMLRELQEENNLLKSDIHAYKEEIHKLHEESAQSSYNQKTRTESRKLFERR